MNDLIIEGLDEQDFILLLSLLNENLVFKASEFEKHSNAQQVITKINDIVEYLKSN
jgi:hypothetical protein